MARPKPALLFVLAVVLVVLLPSAPASGATTCSYNAGTDTLNVGGDPNVGTQLNVFAGELVVAHLSTGGSNLVDCGATATVANTDTIVVEHTSPDENTELHLLDPESFAPGASDEDTGIFICPDEIEIELDLGLGRDEVWLLDMDDSVDEIQFGVEGFDWNPGVGPICLDADITTPDTVDYTMLAAGGADTLSARGSDATGDVVGGELIIDGEGGNDVIRGGDDKDRLTGGAGRDKLFGMEGLDWLLAEDGTRDKKLDCGDGANSSEFAVRDGKDPKPKSC